jgi:hypothetical protein
MPRVILAALLILTVAPSQAATMKGALPVARTLIEAGLDDPDCTLSFDEATKDLDAPQDLGDGKKLLEIPCWRAAYQAGSIFFVFDPAAPDEARLLEFSHWNGPQFERRHSISSATYDPVKKRLTSLHRGRSLGDCGSSGAWVWNGNEFKLESYWLKADCNGQRFNPVAEPAKWKVFPKSDKN